MSTLWHPEANPGCGHGYYSAASERAYPMLEQSECKSQKVPRFQVFNVPTKQVVIQGETVDLRYTNLCRGVHRCDSRGLHSIRTCRGGRFTGASCVAPAPVHFPRAPAPVVEYISQAPLRSKHVGATVYQPQPPRGPSVPGVLETMLRRPQEVSINVPQVSLLRLLSKTRSLVSQSYCVKVHVQNSISVIATASQWDTKPLPSGELAELFVFRNIDR